MKTAALSLPAPRPWPLRWPRVRVGLDKLQDTSGWWRSILSVTLAVESGQFIFRCLAEIIIFGRQPRILFFYLTPKGMYQTMVVAPLVETTLMVPVIWILTRFEKRPGVVAVIVGAVAGLLHFNSYYGWTAAWSFFLWTLLFMTWRKRSLAAAYFSTVAAHSASNAFVWAFEAAGAWLNGPGTYSFVFGCILYAIEFPFRWVFG